MTPKVILYVSILLIIPVISRVINIILGRILFRTIEKLTLINLEEFYQHVTKMDYETLENQDIQDQKNRAVNLLRNSFTVVDYLCNLISAIITLISISSIIVFLNPIVILFIIVIIFVNSIIMKRLDDKKFEADKKIQAKEWRQWGINFMLDMFEYA